MRRDHALKKLLIDLGISKASSFEPYYPRTRERDDVSVFRCKKSDVFILSIDEVPRSHYAEKVFNGRGAHDRSAALKATKEDTERRLQQHLPKIRRKRWLDVGTGAGGILDAFRPYAKEIAAVEPQDLSRESLSHAGYTVYPSLAEVPDREFDVVTFFHVLEHLADPLAELRQARRLLAKGGTLVIEVPHARDALIDLYGCEAFKAHTFWHEHLILHTRESLRALLRAAGFRHIEIMGYQRYPLANHLYWLAKGKPGGQKAWPQLRDQALEDAYANVLTDADATDTLIAIAKK